MSLYGALDKTKHFSEFSEPLILDGNTVTSAATRKATALENLGLTATAAEINQLDAVTLTSEATLATEAGVGITAGSGTVYTSKVTTVGNVAVTQIFVDITGLTVSTTLGDILGVDGVGAAHLGRITAAECGQVFEGWMTCLEAPTATESDYDLYSAVEATGVEDTGIGAITSVALLAAAANWTAGMTKPLTTVPIVDSYLYLANGAGGDPGTMTAGQFVITLKGIIA